MFNRVIQLLVLIALGMQPAEAFDNSNGPELPAQCGSIVVPEGNKLAFHAYARGAQIYKWNVVTQAWELVAPQAGLFAEEGYHGEIGTHWSNMGKQERQQSRRSSRTGDRLHSRFNRHRVVVALEVSHRRLRHLR